MKKIYLFACVLLITSVVSAQTKIWNNVSGDWSDPAKWSPLGVPTASDDVNIASGNISITTQVSSKSILTAANTQVNIVAGGQLRINGAAGVGMTLNAGSTLTVGGELMIGDSAAVGTNGILANNATIYNLGQVRIGNITSGEGLTLVGDTLINNGTIEIGLLGPVNGGRAFFADHAFVHNTSQFKIANINYGTEYVFRLNDGTHCINDGVLEVGEMGDITGSGIWLDSSTFTNNQQVYVSKTTNHGFTVNRGSSLVNSNLIQLGGSGHIGGVGLYIWRSSTFRNNATGQVLLKSVEFDGFSLDSLCSAENYGSIIAEKVGWSPVNLYANSIFHNYGTINGAATPDVHYGCFYLIGGSQFINYSSGNIVMGNASPAYQYPILSLWEPGTLFRNHGLVTIGQAATEPADAVSIQNGLLINESTGIIKVLTTQRNGLNINNGNLVNSGIIEFQKVTVRAINAHNNSTLTNSGTIRTGIPGQFSTDAIWLESGAQFNNIAAGEIYVNHVGSANYGVYTSGAQTRFFNNAKIAFGNLADLQATIALHITNSSIFENQSSGILDFISCANDAILCNAVTGAPNSSDFRNYGTVKFGNIINRGLYNPNDPTYSFRNYGRFETRPNGKMKLQAAVTNETGSQLINNDGFVTATQLFVNKGKVFNDGMFFNLVGFTNEDSVINNNSWEGAGTFTNNKIYQGIGSFDGTVFNNNTNGIVVPGNSPGCTNFLNGFTSQPNSGLAIEVNGNTACLTFDQVNVTGTATITGALNVTFGGGYIPTLGDMITILKSTSVSGTFTSHNLSSGWTVLYNTPAAGDITLQRLTTLPLTLLDFDAEKSGQKVKASWTTANEINSSHFELERSENGSQFQQLGTIPAVNTAGDHHYQFTDPLPVVGINYYRLRIVDINGQYAYSPVVSVDMGSASTTISAIYPNPAKDIVHIAVTESSNDLSIQVVSLDGKIIMTKRLATRGIHELNVSALPAGIYIIKTTNGETCKLIKQ